MVGANISNWDSRVRLRFFSAKVSVADAKTATWRIPSLTARSRPRSLGTSTGSSRARSPRSAVSPVISSAASASWGTHFGCTKLVASTIGRPACSSRSTNSALTSVGTDVLSFWRPSRGPTS